MVTIQLVSEDFSAQDLLLHLQEHLDTPSVDLKIVEPQKEGLSFLQDAVEFVITDETSQKVIDMVLEQAMLFAAKKAHDFAFPKPHIHIKFSNGQHKKIFYAGKSDKAIVRELLSEINDGQVVKIFFKS